MVTGKQGSPGVRPNSFIEREIATCFRDSEGGWRQDVNRHI
jgi:hypothetical protein